MTEKEIIRKELLIKRKPLCSLYSPFDPTIAKTLSHLVKPSIKKILVYYPLKGEISLFPLYKEWHHQGIELFFPRIISKNNRTMDFFSANPYKVSENSPCLWEPPLDKHKIFTHHQKDTEIPIIIPSLLIDNEGFRLGFGGGFYDVFLARFPHLLRIAVQYSAYILKTPLPRDSWDIGVDIAISEQNIYDFRK